MARVFFALKFLYILILGSRVLFNSYKKCGIGRKRE